MSREYKAKKRAEGKSEKARLAVDAQKEHEVVSEGEDQETVEVKKPKKATAKKGLEPSKPTQSREKAKQIGRSSADQGIVAVPDSQPPVNEKPIEPPKPSTSGK